MSDQPVLQPSSTSATTPSSALKRPRSRSIPTSPSSSSSPKRANSEDPFASSSDSGLLGSNMGAQGPGSSPLRGEEGVEEDTGSWVRRTGDVSLDREVDEGNHASEESSQEDYKRCYELVKQPLPSPLQPYSIYYLLSSDQLIRLSAKAGIAPSKDAPAEARPTLYTNLEPEKVWIPKPLAGTPEELSITSEGEAKDFWRLRDGLVEGDDFVIITEETWTKCKKIPGLIEGPSLPRFGLPGDRVEIAPPIYTLHLVNFNDSTPSTSTTSTPSKPPIKFSCPSTTPIQTFVKIIENIFEMSPRNPIPRRAWSLEIPSPSDTHALSTLPSLGTLEIPSNLLPSISGKLLSAVTAATSCAEMGFTDGDVFALEVGHLNGEKEEWAVDVNEAGKAVEKNKATVPPPPPGPLFSSKPFFAGTPSSNTSLNSNANPNATASSSQLLGVGDTGIQTRSQSRGPRVGKGLVGLQNLGNTCFMNSAVQCLSNTPELSEYFLSGVYREELNRDNPLGMSGQVAESFGTVIENLWTSAPHGSYSPRQFKYTTSRFAPSFAGYGQHDTQEFIAFLLDGLHEDLNRIIKKPYIEKPDWKAGGGMKELAELGRECWTGYKKRNDSVIVDLFQGQLMSTLVCPDCHKESITMDPFMYLTVPLPIAQNRPFKLRFVPLDPESPSVDMTILMPSNASFMQVKEKIGSSMKCAPTSLIGIDLWKNMIYNFWLDGDPHSTSTNNDVVVFYETAATISATHRAVGSVSTDGSIVVPVHTMVDRNQYHRECSLPLFFITLSKAEACEPAAVRAAINRGYTRHVKAEMKAQLLAPRANTPAPSVDDDPPVAEIHLDDNGARVIEVPASAPSSTRNSLDVNRFNYNAQASSSSSSLPTREELYKVYVSEASTSSASSAMNFLKSKDNTVTPIWKGQIDDGQKSWSILEKRKKPKTHFVNRLASSVVSLVSSSASMHGSENGDDDEVPPLSPIVRPGEAIFCEWSSQTYNEYISSEQPEVETFVDPAIEAHNRKQKEGVKISLDDCLDEFSKEETLGQDDLWYCPVCKKHQAATKKLEIYKAPDILVICIKRFGSSRRMSDKLDQLVQFPIDGLDLEERIGERKVAKSLDLSGEQAKEFGVETSAEPMIYDLYAVDNHFGGMGGGHYTAFCRNKVDEQWYNYDDSHVSKASPNAIQSRAAYLLFYRRRTGRPIGGISKVKSEAASRVHTPQSASPAVGLSTLPSVLADAEPPREPELRSIDDEDELPSYTTGSSSPSTPIPASPTISDGDIDVDLETDSEPKTSTGDSTTTNTTRYGSSTDLRSIGSTLGYGNTAWGGGVTPSSITFGFGQVSPATTEGTIPLSSPDSEGDDERP